MSIRSKISLAILAGSLAFAACSGPLGPIKTWVREDSWETIPGTNLQIRLSPLEKNEISLALITDPKAMAEAPIIARGRSVVGSTLTFEFKGKMCRMEVLSQEPLSITDYPAHVRKPGPYDPMRTREFMGLVVETTCSKGAVRLK